MPSTLSLLPPVTREHSAVPGPSVAACCSAAAMVERSSTSKHMADLFASSLGSGAGQEDFLMDTTELTPGQVAALHSA